MYPVIRMGLAAAVILAAQCVQAAPNAFRDPLDTPAREVMQPLRAMMLGGELLPGGQLIAVGRRGVVLRSTDGGKAWNQSKVPLSTDLLAVSFIDDKQGWAVGHAGVVIHTSDGGVNWQRQLDGRALPDLLIKHYTPAASAGDELAQRNLQEAERFKEDGPGRPLLDVHFSDALNGIAVGAYNLAIRTKDGGKTWDPISETIDNAGGMHLYRIASIDGTLWIAGEQGLLLKQDAQTQRFEKVKTPYEGTFFGVVGTAKELYVFGLRGNALRSGDGGLTWSALKTGTVSNLTSGAVLSNGHVVLGGMNGELLQSSDGGATFSRVSREKNGPVFSISSIGTDRLLVCGPSGVNVVGLAQSVATAQAPASTKEK